MTRTPRAPRVTLHITEELIEDAVPRDSSHCLWAEAVKASVPDAKNISVDIQTIRFTDSRKGLRYTYLTPRVAQIALIQFDQGIRPTPHSVSLRGGQVTASGSRQVRAGKPLSEAERQQRSQAAAKGRTAQKATTLNKQTIKQRGKDGTVPDRIGGRTPPIAAGRRRAFGLRGLEF